MVPKKAADYLPDLANLRLICEGDMPIRARKSRLKAEGLENPTATHDSRTEAPFSIMSRACVRRRLVK
jgi:hypothetical protein